MPRQDLDGHIATQPSVACSVNFAYPALADQRDDLVRAEFVASGKEHKYEQVYRCRSEDGAKSCITAYFGKWPQNALEEVDR